MLVRARALTHIAIVGTFPAWAIATALLDTGTTMVYPTLLAAIGDVAHPGWRARSVDIYRLWRDGGYAAGAVLGGIVETPLAATTTAAAPRRRQHRTFRTRTTSRSHPEDFVFTGSASEASTLAIRRAALARHDFGDHLIT